MKSVVFKWAAILGAIGFACGFFGPIVLSPQSNQGPMLGIFITGPGGVVLGLLFGLIVAIMRVSEPAGRNLLIGAGSLLALVTLYFSTPPPEFMGRVIDAEIAGCMAPSDALPGAINEWQKSIDQVPRASARDGWREEATRTAQADNGVVLTMRIRRDLLVYEHRKPWNYGKLVPQRWRNAAEIRSYYARTPAGGCASFAKVKRDVYFPVSEREPEPAWPARSMPNFLRLQVLGPVPDKYQDLFD